MSKKSKLDQYYTSTDIALMCYEQVKPYATDNFLEPCAGTGAFFNLMPEDSRVGVDLEPKCSGKGMVSRPTNFLTLKGSLEGVTVVSNPPFGFACKLAVDFFNKCGEAGAEVIAFIVPKTFRKVSITNKLNMNYRLEKDITLPKNSFILDGKPYDVPCCFQIWIRTAEMRKPVDTRTQNPWFEFTTKANADYAIRRVGGRAGTLLEGTDHSESSTYFIKILDRAVVPVLKGLDMGDVRDNTAGVRSVSKVELVNRVRGILC